MACLDDSSTSTTIYAPTLLTVDPTSFLGTVRCGSDVFKYVVTLTQVLPGGALSNLGSAPPTECNTPTTFGTPKIVGGGYYIVEIDGYDRDDIVPQGGIDSGAREMRDPMTMAIVSPRYMTTCGEVHVPVDGDVPSDVKLNPLRFPTIALPNIEVIVHGCLPLRPAEPPDGGTDGGDDGASPDGQTDPAPDASDDVTGSGAGEAGPGR